MIDADDPKRAVNDPLWLIIFETTEGEIRYGCRSTQGQNYTNFYRWLHTTSYRSTSEDFPWDYFVFDDKNDELAFILKYEQDIHEYSFK